MEDTIRSAVRALLAGYIEVDESTFSMTADLDLEYEIDSTEVTEVARKIEELFSVQVSKSSREAWTTGEDIAAFVSRARASAVAPDRRTPALQSVVAATPAVA